MENQMEHIENTSADTSSEIAVRQEKLAALKAQGKDPYVITTYDVTNHAADVIDGFEEYEGKTVRLAGRIMARREMGKASFLDLRDSSGRIQLYVKINLIGEEAYEEMKKWDIGDIIGAEGEVFKTRRGEISLKAASMVLLTKSLLPLPEKFHGLKDTDMRYRQRYLDLIVNPEVKDTFVKRTLILRAIRNCLDGQGFMEVETPTLQRWQAALRQNLLLPTTMRWISPCI